MERFSETYYWQTHTSPRRGLQRADVTICERMADNFAWRSSATGISLNGNRTYYLSRSQPPVFRPMVELFEEDGVRGAKRYLEHLKMEYAFWMDGGIAAAP
ncbi:trehalase family glycosidase [Shigella flexneri]